MIMIMKKIYENPMLQVVSIKKNDIITDSVPVDPNASNTTDRAPGQRGIFDPYDPYNAGY